MPRLQAFFVMAKTVKTKGGLERIDLTFRLEGGSTVRVYGWNEQVDVLAGICQPRALYSLFMLKVMPNSGESADGTQQDRGGSFPIKLLFEDSSNFIMGRVGGGQKKWPNFGGEKKWNFLQGNSFVKFFNY
jgi:hypothetical protein